MAKKPPIVDERRGGMHLPNPDVQFHMLKTGMKVWDRKGNEHGLMTGSSRTCAVPGCRGVAICVRWPDKRITFPCIKSLKNHADGFQIM